MVRSADTSQVLDRFTAAEAVIGPVLDMADIVSDAHYAHRGAIEVLHDTPMQSLIARLSATPGALRWAGRGLDADGDEIREAAGDPADPTRDQPAVVSPGTALRTSSTRLVEVFGWFSVVPSGTQPDRATDTRAGDPAVPVGILREVLLVIRLGVVEVPRA